MNGTWIIIEGDDHVLSFDGDTILKIAKYRQELKDEYQKYINSKLACGEQSISNYKYDKSGRLNGQLTCLDWSSYPIECDLLLLGREEWEKGKMKIKIAVKFSEVVKELQDIAIGDSVLIARNLKYSDLYAIEVSLEFLSDNIAIDCKPAKNEVDSALDDIRKKMIESNK
jgi:KGK domain